MPGRLACRVFFLFFAKQMHSFLSSSSVLLTVLPTGILYSQRKSGTLKFDLACKILVICLLLGT